MMPVRARELTMKACRMGLALLLGLTLFGTARADPRIGDPAPPLDLLGLDGKKVAVEPGRITVVDFYATWCGPCQQAMAALDAIGRALGWRFRLIVVDAGEDPVVVREFIAHHPLPDGAGLAFDPDGGAARRWGQHRFPTTYLIDGRGVIQHINRGYGPGYEMRLRVWLRAMLTAGAGSAG